jgi:hypothetical protein
LRLKRAILLAIWATARPKDKNEPIPQEEMAELNKLLAEVGPTEKKMILGWLLISETFVYTSQRTNICLETTDT